MKKVIIGLFAVMASTSFVKAQDSNVLSAWEYMQVYDQEKRSGNMTVALENLVKAKESIDAASVNEKTAGKSKTWKRRAEVYIKLIQEKDPSMNVYKKDIMNEIYSSIQKARTVEINEKTGKPKIFEEDQLRNNISFLCDTLSGAGRNAFSAGEYKEAGKYFEKRYNLLKDLGITDTVTYSNMFLAAYRDNDVDRAVKIGDDLMKMNYRDKNLYGTMARIYQEKGESEKGLQIIKDARKKYPQNTEFITEELNFYLTANDNVNSVRVMNEAIEANKNDKETLKALYFNSGVIYSNLNDTVKSRDYYTKALEIDPEYFNALNNLSSSYLNEANGLVKAANALPISAQKQYDELKNKANEVYKKAGVLLEKAYEVKTKELEKTNDNRVKALAQKQLNSLKGVLSEIFIKLGDEAKAEKYKQ